VLGGLQRADADLRDLSWVLTVFF